MSLAECLAHRAEVPEPPDLVAFWEQSIAAAWEHARPAMIEPVDNGLRMVNSFDVSFSGANGDAVCA
ncbi:MAG: acetylxylan esterase [Actinomycetota bacterium]|nr:acetylxylan esterase [Actinomycetota bacterium]